MVHSKSLILLTLCAALAVPAAAAALSFPVEVSVLPGPLGSKLKARVFDNLDDQSSGRGYSFGTTFTPIVEIEGAAILLTIEVVAPPPLPPGTLTSPSFFFLDQDFFLGLLGEGKYSLEVLLKEEGDVVGTGRTVFSVVPEPSTALLVALGLLGLSSSRSGRMSPAF